MRCQIRVREARFNTTMNAKPPTIQSHSDQKASRTLGRAKHYERIRIVALRRTASPPSPPSRS